MRDHPAPALRRDGIGVLSMPSTIDLDAAMGTVRNEGLATCVTGSPKAKPKGKKNR